jgi:uncharacterized phage protein (TIGR02220 family)
MNFFKVFRDDILAIEQYMQNTKYTNIDLAVIKEIYINFCDNARYSHQQDDLKQGQFLFSVSKIAEHYKIRKSKISKFIEILEKVGVIKIVAKFPYHNRKASIGAISSYTDIVAEDEAAPAEEVGVKDELNVTEEERKLIRQIIRRFNKMRGTNYILDNKYDKYLIPHIRNGYKLAHFKKVIDNKFICNKNGKYKKACNIKNMLGENFEMFLEWEDFEPIEKPKKSKKTSFKRKIIY